VLAREDEFRRVDESGCFGWATRPGIYIVIASRARRGIRLLSPSRIAAMCRSLDQPVLMSAAFADVGDIKRRLVSVGRYALRGVSHSQELFTLDPDG
jgi:hypothetical protein